MIEPENDEERKALRLLNAIRSKTIPKMAGEPFLEEPQRDGFLCALAEARAILREEQAAANPLSTAGENELASVRDEIRLRSETIQAALYINQQFGVAEEQRVSGNAQIDRFWWLLKRERELMGDLWQT